jgi:hypothetical protein
MIIVGIRITNRSSVYEEKKMKTSVVLIIAAFLLASCAYVYGNYVHGSATTRTTGGRTYYFSKPGTTNTIVCFKDKPEIGGLVYDAYYLFKSIKGKYGIKRYY